MLLLTVSVVNDDDDVVAPDGVDAANADVCAVADSVADDETGGVLADIVVDGNNDCDDDDNATVVIAAADDMLEELNPPFSCVGIVNVILGICENKDVKILFSFIIYFTLKCKN